MTNSLSSLKILDFSTLLPGPFASMLLADMGAEVIRIEAPDRPDMIRMLPPFDGQTSAWHGMINRSKRSLAVDLKKNGGSEIIRRLVQTYDIVLEQFRPGVMDRLGIGYEALCEMNPKVIYCAITGYGQTGPYRNRAGHDNNFLALSGIMSHTGRRSHGPLPLGIQVGDINGSFGAVTGILAAFIHRLQTGEGQFIDISMTDMAISLNSMAAAGYLVSGENPDYETGWLNGGTYYDFYRTADNRYLSVGSLEPKFWQGFCSAIERPDLISEGINTDPETQKRLKTEIQHAILQKSFAEWTEIFSKIDVCVEPVLTISEMIEHPHTQARQMFVDVPKPDGTTQRQAGSPFRFSRSQTVYKHIGTAIGENTHEILTEAGYSNEEIEVLQAEGVILC